MRRLSDKLREFSYFISLYSAQGLIIICAALYFFIKVITQKVFEINEIALEGGLGIDIKNKSYDDTFYPLLLLLLLFIILYFLFFNTEAIVLRSRFNNALNKKSTTIFSQNNLRIIFDQKFPKSFFQINATLELQNITAGNKKVRHYSKPRGLLQSGELFFDLSHLPTGKYKIESIEFSLKDNLGLFDAKGITLKDKNRELFVSNPSLKTTALIFENIDRSNLKEESENVSPTENFYHSREYRRGDEVKKIHWKNTAKTGKLVIRLPEDEPQYDDDLNIVLNLFVPLSKEVDQSLSIANFLDSFLIYLTYILENVDKKVHLYINTDKSKEFKNLQEYNIDHIKELVLKEAICQAETSLQKYLIKNKIENPIIFSLSSDTVTATYIQNLYIYFLSKDFTKNKRGAFKNIYIYKKGDYPGLPVSEFLRYYNPIHLVGAWDGLIKLRKLIKKNEREYLKSREVTKL